MKKIFLCFSLFMYDAIYGALTLRQYVDFQENDETSDLFSNNFDEGSDLIRGYLALQYGSLIAQRQFGNIEFGDHLWKGCSWKDDSKDAMTKLLIMTEPSVGSDTLNATGTGSLEDYLGLQNDEAGKLRLIAGMLKLAKDVRARLDDIRKGNAKDGLKEALLDDAIKGNPIDDCLLLYLYDEWVPQGLREFADMLANSIEVCEKSDNNAPDEITKQKMVVGEKLMSVYYPEVKEKKKAEEQIKAIENVEKKLTEENNAESNEISLQDLGVLSSFFTYINKNKIKIDADTKRINDCFKKIKKADQETQKNEIRNEVSAIYNNVKQQCGENFSNIINEYATSKFSSKYSKQAGNPSLKFAFKLNELRWGKGCNISSMINKFGEDFSEIQPDISNKLTALSNAIKYPQTDKVRGLVKTIVNAVKLERLDEDVKVKESDKYEKKPYYRGYVNDIICTYAWKVCNGKDLPALANAIRETEDIDRRFTLKLKSNAVKIGAGQDLWKIMGNAIDSAQKKPQDSRQSPNIKASASEAGGEQTIENNGKQYTSVATKAVWTEMKDFPEIMPFNAGITPPSNSRGIYGVPTKDVEVPLYPDCMETMMRQLFCILLCTTDENNQLRIETKRIPNGSQLKAFFEEQNFRSEEGAEKKSMSEIANDGSDDVRKAWGEICAHHGSVIKYLKGEYELYSNWETVINLICILMKGYEGKEDEEIFENKYDKSTMRARKEAAKKLIEEINDNPNGFTVNEDNLDKAKEKIISTLNTLLGIRGDVILEVKSVDGNPLKKNEKMGVYVTNGSLEIFPTNYNEKNNNVVVNSNSGHAWVDAPKRNSKDPEFTEEIKEKSSGLHNITQMVTISNINVQKARKKQVNKDKVAISEDFAENYPIVNQYKLMQKFCEMERKNIQHDTRLAQSSTEVLRNVTAKNYINGIARIFIKSLNSKCPLEKVVKFDQDILDNLKELQRKILGTNITKNESENPNEQNKEQENEVNPNQMKLVWKILGFTGQKDCKGQFKEIREQAVQELKKVEGKKEEKSTWIAFCLNNLTKEDISDGQINMLSFLTNFDPSVWKANEIAGNNDSNNAIKAIHRHCKGEQNYQQKIAEIFKGLVNKDFSINDKYHINLLTTVVGCLNKDFPSEDSLGKLWNKCMGFKLKKNNGSLMELMTAILNNKNAPNVTKDSLSELWNKCTKFNWEEDDKTLIGLLEAISKKSNELENLLKEDFDVGSIERIELLERMIRCLDEDCFSQKSLEELWDKCINFDWKEEDETLIGLLEAISKKSNELENLLKKDFDVKDTKHIELLKRMIRCLNGDCFSQKSLKKLWDKCIGFELTKENGSLMKLMTTILNNENAPKVTEDSLGKLWDKCIGFELTKENGSLMKLMTTILNNENAPKVTEDSLGKLWGKCIGFELTKENGSLMKLMTTILNNENAPKVKKNSLKKLWNKCTEFELTEENGSLMKLMTAILNNENAQNVTKDSLKELWNECTKFELTEENGSLMELMTAILNNENAQNVTKDSLKELWNECTEFELTEENDSLMELMTAILNNKNAPKVTEDSLGELWGKCIGFELTEENGSLMELMTAILNNKNAQNVTGDSLGELWNECTEFELTKENGSLMKLMTTILNNENAPKVKKNSLKKLWNECTKFELTKENGSLMELMTAILNNENAQNVTKDSLKELWNECTKFELTEENGSLMELMTAILNNENAQNVTKDSLSELWNECTKFELTEENGPLMELMTAILNNKNAPKVTEDSLGELWGKCIEFDWEEDDKTLIGLLEAISKKSDELENLLKEDFDVGSIERIELLERMIRCLDEDCFSQKSLKKLWNKCINFDWKEEDETLIGLLEAISKKSNELENLLKKDFDVKDTKHIELLKRMIRCLNGDCFSQKSLKKLWGKCINFDWKEKDKTLIGLMRAISDKLTADNLLSISEKLANLNKIKNKSKNKIRNKDLKFICDKLINEADLSNISNEHFLNICKISHNMYKNIGLKNFNRAQAIDKTIKQKRKEGEKGFIDRWRIPYFYTMEEKEAIDFINGNDFLKESFGNFRAQCKKWKITDRRLKALPKTKGRKSRNRRNRKRRV